jgi:hypothetical protein
MRGETEMLGDLMLLRIDSHEASCPIPSGTRNDWKSSYPERSFVPLKAIIGIFGNRFISRSAFAINTTRKDFTLPLFK